MEYEGLEGVVKTGCMNTPKLESRYCELHTENVAVPHHLDPDSGTPQTTQSVEESVVATIIGKRTTRNGDYFQVHRNNLGQQNVDTLLKKVLVRMFKYNIPV